VEWRELTKVAQQRKRAETKERTGHSEKQLSLFPIPGRFAVYPHRGPRVHVSITQAQGKSALLFCMHSEALRLKVPCIVLSLGTHSKSQLPIH
jgi:hypothetical protein